MNSSLSNVNLGLAVSSEGSRPTMICVILLFVNMGTWMVDQCGRVVTSFESLCARCKAQNNFVNIFLVTCI